MNFWWWIAQHVATTAVLVGVVLAVCRALPARPALRHALWVVVLVKFLMPPGVAWPWPVQALIPRFAVEPVATELVIDDVEARPPAALEPSPFLAEALAASASHAEPLDQPAAEVAVETPTNEPEPIETLASIPPAIAASTAQPTNAARPAMGATDWLRLVQWIACALWAVGSITVAARRLAQIRSLRRVVQAGTPAPGHLSNAVGRLAEQLGMRPLEARVSAAVDSPLVWCLGRPCIVWPASLVEPACIARMDGVIAHELAHVSRHDHWTAWLEMAAGVAWWWNPLFWLARRKLRESGEMACDALVLSLLPESRRSYAHALLELSNCYLKSEPAAALGVRAGSRRTFERRLTMILSHHVVGRVSFGGLTAVAILAALAAPNWSLGQDPDKTEDAAPAAETPKESTQPESTERKDPVSEAVKFLTGNQKADSVDQEPEPKSEPAQETEATDNAAPAKKPEKKVELKTPGELEQRREAKELREQQAAIKALLERDRSQYEQVRQQFEGTRGEMERLLQEIVKHEHVFAEIHRKIEGLEARFRDSQGLIAPPLRPSAAVPQVTPVPAKPAVPAQPPVAKLATTPAVAAKRVIMEGAQEIDLGGNLAANQVDLTSLAMAIADARGAVRLAESQLANTQRANIVNPQAVSKEEVQIARVNVDTSK